MNSVNVTRSSVDSNVAEEYWSSGLSTNANVKHGDGDDNYDGGAQATGYNLGGVRR